VPPIERGVPRGGREAASLSGGESTHPRGDGLKESFGLVIN
jgi:hypothetical protein